LLNVTTGSTGYGAEPRFEFSYQGGLFLKLPARPVSGSRGFGPFAMQAAQPRDVQVEEDATLIADTSGEFLSGKREAYLPFMLGPLSTLALDPIDAGLPTWSRENLITMTTTRQNDGSGDSPFPRFRHPRMDPFGPRLPHSDEPRQQVVSATPARERYRYEWIAATDERPVLKRQYTLESLKAGTDGREFKVEYAAEIVFDSDQMVPQSLKGEGQAVFSGNNITVTLPIKLAFERVQGEPARASRFGRWLPMISKRLTEQEAEQFLLDLRHKDAARRRDAMYSLNLSGCAGALGWLGLSLRSPSEVDHGLAVPLGLRRLSPSHPDVPALQIPIGSSCTRRSIGKRRSLPRSPSRSAARTSGSGMPPRSPFGDGRPKPKPLPFWPP
jgi:hypothetical protein